jgi:hypothetical protein
MKASMIILVILLFIILTVVLLIMLINPSSDFKCVKGSTIRDGCVACTVDCPTGQKNIACSNDCQDVDPDDPDDDVIKHWVSTDLLQPNQIVPRIVDPETTKNVIVGYQIPGTGDPRGESGQKTGTGYLIYSGGPACIGFTDTEYENIQWVVTDDEDTKKFTTKDDCLLFAVTSSGYSRNDFDHTYNVPPCLKEGATGACSPMTVPGNSMWICGNPIGVQSKNKKGWSEISTDDHQGAGNSLDLKIATSTGKKKKICWGAGPYQNCSDEPYPQKYCTKKG